MGNQVDDVLEVWGGIECTYNRVGNEYFDQLTFSGHYNREDDLDKVAGIGIRMIRYPILWEKHMPEPDNEIDWSFAEKSLQRMQQLGVTPVAGLVHHGSGPRHVNFYDGSFENGLAAYARRVAEKFPWIEYYTPVNEPLTTARFCGLYGHWYPHKKTTYDFLKILLSECKATVLAMQEIRKVNPNAKLIQTEDLAKCHSTRLLKYQAKFENERRWVSYELICGKLTPKKLMWKFMVKQGIEEHELQFFLDNPCPPDVCGFNYYKTSERFLDEDLSKYPEQYHGGNNIHDYADIHRIMIGLDDECGPYQLLKEAWKRLRLPLAITECHLYEPRDEQIRWVSSIWKALRKLKSEKVSVKAITGWALFGSFGWNNLVTSANGAYEPGVFNLSCGMPRPTAVAEYLCNLISDPGYRHPVVLEPGNDDISHVRPILIIGKKGLLASAFGRVFEARNISHRLVSHDELDITDTSKVREFICAVKPWAVINTAGNIDIDGAESNADTMMQLNYHAAVSLAEACKTCEARYLTFSTDMVFDGNKGQPYVESDPLSPLNLYGKSKSLAEEDITRIYPEAIIVRTSSFFSPWDYRDFVAHTLDALKQKRTIDVANDLHVSPTYLPDLVLECLNLLLDNESGIFHVVNEGSVTWAEFAAKVAEFAGVGLTNVRFVPDAELRRPAPRPRYTTMTSERGIRLPSLDDALRRYFEDAEEAYVCEKIAV